MALADLIRIVGAEYGYVILAGIYSVFIMEHLGAHVSGARNRLKVEAPSLYADAAEARVDKDKFKFNCIQRGHQNALETYTQTLFMLAFGGLKHPIISAVLMIIWGIGREMFMKGYEEAPGNRYKYFGFIHHLGRIGLLVTSVSTALSFLGYL